MGLGHTMFQNEGLSELDSHWLISNKSLANEHVVLSSHLLLRITFFAAKTPMMETFEISKQDFRNQCHRIYSCTLSVGIARCYNWSLTAKNSLSNYC